MNYCIINGKAYDVNVVELTETFNKLYTENTKRTIANGRMFLDPIGTFISHNVTFAPLNNPGDFDALWDYLKFPHRDGFPVEIADGQSTIAYEAYTSTGARKLTRVVNGILLWDNMQITFTPMEPQVMP